MKIFQLLFLFIISFVLVGCASHKEVTTSNYQDHLTQSTSSRIDSIFLRDSVQVHDSIFVTVLGDTVYKEKFRTVYRDRIQYKYKTKTDTLIVKDTISTVLTETVSTPSESLSWWDEARIRLANLVIIIVLLYGIVWFIKSKR